MVARQTTMNNLSPVESVTSAVVVSSARRWDLRDTQPIDRFELLCLLEAMQFEEAGLVEMTRALEAKKRTGSESIAGKDV